MEGFEVGGAGWSGAEGRGGGGDEVAEVSWGKGGGRGSGFVGGGEMWEGWRVGVGVGLRDWVRWLMLDCSGCTVR